MASIKTLRFPRPIANDFTTTVKERVSDYFKERKISKYGNANMVIKTIFMISLFLLPFILMLTGVVQAVWLMYIMWIIMGFGMAGIGLSVMHDANHGAYAKNRNVNKYIGYIINMVGGSTLNWKIQHNVLHHSYTNVDGLDEDIAPGNLMRFSPSQKHFKIHRLQHFYAWFFYGLMTIGWCTAKDFKQLIRYKKKDLLKGQGVTFGNSLTRLIIAKVFYFALHLALPLILIDAAWYNIVLGFLAMHYVAGMTLACIFQPAHVIEGTSFPLPDDQGNAENQWTIHQLLTTTNFAMKSRWFSWYVGGLNFQIEHHLFPNICHVHYRKISKIVQKTAKEFNLPYYSKKTFVGALWSHGKMLKILGSQADVAL